MLKLILFAGCVALACGLLAEEDYGMGLKVAAPMLHEKCSLFSGVDQNDIKKVQYGDFNVGDSMMRYVFCIWIESGLVDIDLNPNKQVMTLLEPEKLRGRGVDIYYNCAKAGAKSGVPTKLGKIWNSAQCVYKADPENFILF